MISFAYFLISESVFVFKRVKLISTQEASVAEDVCSVQEINMSGMTPAARFCVCVIEYEQ
jgi:hypothetical protein